MSIVISSPYSLDLLHGNNISANRIADLLRESGQIVHVIQSWDEIPIGTDSLIALHARKSHAAILKTKENCPDARVILYLTGTDLYHDIPNGCALSQRSMELADAIVVSQEASLESVPLAFKNKARVVYNSINLPKLTTVKREQNLFTIASHMRAVKQPFFVVEALSKLDVSVKVKLMGSEIDAGSSDMAKKQMRKESRFEWLGEQSYEETLTWMNRSIATINTSLAEGGANAIGESIVLGRPVLASRIEGNIGMLGEEYDGYFCANSPQELASLIEKVIGDPLFLAHLEQQVRKRSEKYSRENERNGWLALL